MKGTNQLILSRDSITEMVQGYVKDLLGYSSKDVHVVDWVGRVDDVGLDEMIVTIEETHPEDNADS